MYEDRFWKKNWDKGLMILNPNLNLKQLMWNIIKQRVEKAADKTALSYLGVEISFGKLNQYANQFANMLVDNGFAKGDIVGINLPNLPEYVITLIGALRAGCIISGVSPLLSAEQIKYQLNDLGSTGRKVGLVTLDAIFAGHIVKIASDIPQLKLVVATSVAGFPSRKLNRCWENF